MTSERYSVELTEQAKKDVKKLRPLAEQVIQTLLTLETEPTRGNVLTCSLRGTRSLEFSLIFIVGPHEKIYDRAE